MHRRRLTGLLALSALAFHGLYLPAIQTGFGFASDDGVSTVNFLPVLPLLLPIGELPSPEKLGLVLELPAPAVVTPASRLLAPRGPPCRSLAS